MIHYSLVCDSGHGFEGWFRSSGDFDGQTGRGFVSCPTCGSTVITRAPMAPSVRSSGKAEEPEVPRRQPVMMPDPAQKAMLDTLKEIRRRVTENATYVGDRFAEEARRMHYGEVEHKGIYGEATAEEVHSLAEEGVEFQALPTLPDERN